MVELVARGNCPGMREGVRKHPAFGLGSLVNAVPFISVDTLGRRRILCHELADVSEEQ